MKRLSLIFAIIVTFSDTFSQSLILNEIVAKNGTSYTNANGKTPDWIELRNVSSQTIDLSEYYLTTSKMKNSVVPLGSAKLVANGYMLYETTKGNSDVAQWTTVVDYGDVFSYVVPEANISDWTSSSFDDSQWLNGKTPIGYGETDIVTSVPNSRSIFIRRNFTVKHVESIAQMILHMDCDDGFIAYINGTEIARSNMNSNDFDAFSTTYTDGVMKEGQTPPAYAISNFSKVLHEGENTLCIQIHNCSDESSDLIGIPILSIGYAESFNDVQNISQYLSLPCGKSLSLDASSDTLYLLKNSEIIDKISWKDLPADVSIGRVDGDNQNVYYFSETTPNKKNSTISYMAKTLSKPKLTPNAGIYENQIYVKTYSSDNKVSLRYTTNGSVPTESSPIFPDSLKVADNTNLRVRAFRDGYLPSETTTATYLYVQFQTLPIASITAKHADFFDYKTGIYVEGPNAEKAEPHFGANYWQDWEVPVHFEYFDTDGNRVVSQDVGCKIGGNWSRANAQKTLKLYARDQYGKDKINYQFFKDKPISSFHMILLRNAGNDFKNTQMLDGTIAELAKEMNIDRQAYQPAVVYINGKYYGIQNVREKQNEHYIIENYGYDKEDIDIVKNGYELINGTDNDYWEMLDFIENNDMSISSNYEKAKQLLDIPSYIDYYVLEIYMANDDWPGNNYACWRSRSENTPWRYLLFDCDHGFGIWHLEERLTGINLNGKMYTMYEWCTDATSTHYANDANTTKLLRSLLKSPEFRRDYMNATADRLNTTLSSSNIRHVIDSIENLISNEMPDHVQKWGDSYYTLDRQKQNVANMREFGRRRGDILRTQTEEFFSTTGSYKLSLNISENGAGFIHLNTIDVKKFPWSGKYFNNNTITLTAVENPGYTFVRWEGAVSSTEKTISVTTAEATSLTAVFNYVGNVPDIAINEIYYHSFSDDETIWVELLNNGEQSVNLSNWTMTVDRYNQSFTFPENSVISAGEYLVVTKDTTKMKAKYLDISVVGNMKISLPNDFATVSLKNENGITIAQTFYSDELPHAQKADGFGYSCENINGVWYSPSQGGTPGTPNDEEPEISTGECNVVINEINYVSGSTSDSGDWIELYNPSESSSINLKDFIFKDKGGNISVIYDDIIVAPGEYVVFADNIEKFHMVYPNVECHQIELSLNNYVDEISLYNPYEYLEDKVSYSMFEKAWTKSAFGTGRTLSLISPDYDNNKGLNWAASKSLGTPGAENDFILTIEELNKAALSVYPNPCAETVTIAYDGSFTFEIVSSEGKVVLSGNGTQSQTIDMASLPSGMYLAVIRDGQIFETRLFVKK